MGHPRPSPWILRSVPWRSQRCLVLLLNWMGSGRVRPGRSRAGSESCAPGERSPGASEKRGRSGSARFQSCIARRTKRRFPRAARLRVPRDYHARRSWHPLIRLSSFVRASAFSARNSLLPPPAFHSCEHTLRPRMAVVIDRSAGWPNWGVYLRIRRSEKAHGSGAVDVSPSDVAFMDSNRGGGGTLRALRNCSWRERARRAWPRRQRCPQPICGTRDWG